MAQNGSSDESDLLCGDPDPTAWSEFMEDDGMLPAIIRMDSAEVVYEDEKPKARFFGEKYLKGRSLGEGSYSKVKEALDIHTLCRRAVKIVKYRAIRKIPNGYSNVQREIKTLKRLKHANVISLIEEFLVQEKQKLYIVLEYCCCDLQVMLDEAASKHFPEWQAHYFFTQLIEGVDYLHSNGIIHKDIKPANLLLTLDYVLKITDFGVSERLDSFAEDDTITQNQGSPIIQAPEVADGADSFAGFKTDVWSCGITLFRMCSEKYPFDGANVYQLYDNIVKAPISIPGHWSLGLQNLVRGLLTKDASQRYSVADIKISNWYKEHKPKDSDPVLMKSAGGDAAFTMSTISSLEAYIACINGIISPNCDNGVNPEVIGQSGNIPDSMLGDQESAINHVTETERVVSTQASHDKVEATGHRKHKRSSRSKCLLC